MEKGTSFLITIIAENKKEKSDVNGKVYEKDCIIDELKNNLAYAEEPV